MVFHNTGLACRADCFIFSLYTILVMSHIDWIILILTLCITVGYGIYKSKGQTGSQSYVLAGKNASWVSILIGIMATQASAVTFISGPGQSYGDGMRFLQYYFGLPLAMIVISAFFVPYFQKQKVLTAYEYLDKRFDKKTRYLSSILFLISRGISTGLSIVAPSIILNSLFHWDIYACIFIIGGVLISYTFMGGAQSILHTQRLQFSIIIGSMIVAGVMIVMKLPEGIGFSDALYLAGKSNKLNVISTEVDFNSRYNLLSGLIGGFFLALSYFGTDQSQVGRYLTGKGIKESRLGLLFNGIVKIPMQFGILLIGALLFSFYMLMGTPIFFNEKAVEELSLTKQTELNNILVTHEILSNDNINLAKRLSVERDILNAEKEEAYLQRLSDNLASMKSQKDTFKTLIKSENIGVKSEDMDYVFLHFVRNYMPIGLVGLIIAIIFLASWGSISPALNSLAVATYFDLHKSIEKSTNNDKKDLFWARAYTLIWGAICILMACLSLNMGSSLIESVNILGSLFYGPMLGIFLVAFFFKYIKGTAVFWSTLIAETVVFYAYFSEWVSFLWLNVIGAIALIISAHIIQLIIKNKTTATA